MRHYSVLFNSQMDEYNIIFQDDVDYENVYYLDNVTFGSKDDALFYAQARNEASRRAE